jgi:hypothetical protein
LLIRWTINPVFSLNLFYIPAYNITLGFNANLGRFVLVTLEANSRQRSFYLHHRSNPKEKTYLDTRRIALKLRIFYALELTAGYQFDSYTFNAENYTEAQHEIKLPNNFYYQVALKIAF